MSLRSGSAERMKRRANEREAREGESRRILLSNDENEFLSVSLQFLFLSPWSLLQSFLTTPNASSRAEQKNDQSNGGHEIIQREGGGEERSQREEEVFEAAPALAAASPATERAALRFLETATAATPATNTATAPTTIPATAPEDSLEGEDFEEASG